MSNRVLACALVMSAALVACSNPASTVDAGKLTCDCPSAEPPLTGRIVTEKIDPGPAFDLTPGISSTGASCSKNTAILLSGGCQLSDQIFESGGNIHLVDSYKFPAAGITPDGWQCVWDNRGATTAHAIVTLTCLNPAQ